jgi:hypothetical protein
MQSDWDLNLGPFSLTRANVAMINMKITIKLNHISSCFNIAQTHHSDYRLTIDLNKSLQD